MIHERRFFALLGVMTIAVLTVFFLNTQIIDSERHTRINEQMREIRHVDALLNQEIIKDRYRLLHNYDALNDHMRKLADLTAALETGPLADFESTHTDVRHALVNLRREVDNRQRLFEDFKTDNALFKNSLHHLPHIIADFEKLQARGTTQRAGFDTSALLRNILSFNLNGDLAVRRTLDDLLAQLRQQRDAAPGGARKQLSNIIGHANLVMQLRPQLDKTISELLKTGVDQTITPLQDAYFGYYRDRVNLSNRYRMTLYILSSLLLASMFYTLIRLRANSRELFAEKERALVTLHSIGDGVITTDAQGNVNDINSIAETLTGWTNGAARGHRLSEVFKLIDDVTFKVMPDTAHRCLTEGRVVEISEHALLCRADGQESAIEVTGAPIRDRRGLIIGAVVVFHDVTKTRSMARELQWHASHDPLTGLANRREFDHRLKQAIHSAKERDLTHALLYLDLDQFKVVNDTCGHVAGDELLRHITALIQPHLRAIDTLARLGGDEFGLLLESCPLPKAVAIADEIRRTLRDFRFIWKNKVFNVGGSIGITPINRESNSADEVLSAADVACYAAKDQGRNRIHVYEAGNGEIELRHGEMRWTSRIQQAIEENRFRLYVQRIQSVHPAHAGETHYELLLRMIDDTGETIPPGAFIPAAERYNMMPSIDRWVVSTVLKHIRHAQPKSGDTFAINLSGHSLSDEHFKDFVTQQLKEARVMPGAICFEITETAAIANLPRAMRFINTLKAMGCRFALDDFGMGLSSYAYLKNLPVDYLKIDGTFVKDMDDDPVDRELVRSVNQIAHVMGIKTIAECVETEAVWRRIVELNVDFAQGYYVERPRLWLTPIALPAVARR